MADFQMKPLDIRLNTFQQGALNRTMSEEQQKQAVLSSQLADLRNQQLSEELGTYRADAPVREAQRTFNIEDAKSKTLGAKARQNKKYHETMVGGEMADAQMKGFRSEAMGRANKADQVAETLFPLFGQGQKGNFVGVADNLKTALDQLESMGAPNIPQLRLLPVDQQLQLLKQKYDQSIYTADTIRSRLAADQAQKNKLEQIDREGSWKVKTAQAGGASALTTDKLKADLIIKYQSGKATAEEKRQLGRMMVNEYVKGNKQAQDAAFEAANKEARDIDISMRSSSGPFSQAEIRNKPQLSPYVTSKDGKTVWKSPSSKQDFVNNRYNDLLEEPVRRAFPDLFGGPQRPAMQMEGRKPAAGETSVTYDPSTMRFRK